MKKLACVTIIVIASFLVVLSTSAADVVKFGITEIQSGSFKYLGDRVIWGVEAAIKEANEEGGLLRKKIELVIEDNQLKPEMAVQQVEKLILQDGCEIIIQGCSSKVGLAIAEVMPRYKKIWLNINARAMAITGEKFTPYTFRTCSNAAVVARTLAQYFSKQKERKFFLINQDYSWGHDIARYFERFIKQLTPDAQIVGKEFHQLFNEDFTPCISALQASNADYVITGNWGADLLQLIVQSRGLGVSSPFGCAFLDDDSILSQIGNQALGCVSASEYMLGVDTPTARAMEESFYRNSGGKQMAVGSFVSYRGTKMYIAAVRKAGTFETDAVIKAFEGLTWEGPPGTATMRCQDHQILTPMVLGKVVERTKYYSFPYMRPIAIIPAEEVSMTPEESGWKPWTR